MRGEDATHSTHGALLLFKKNPLHEVSNYASLRSPGVCRAAPCAGASDPAIG